MKVGKFMHFAPMNFTVPYTMIIILHNKSAKITKTKLASVSVFVMPPAIADFCVLNLLL